MAYESDSLNRRTLGPAIASAAVGIALGAVAVAGVSIISGQDSVPTTNVVTADNALLGGPEYGSRESTRTIQAEGTVSDGSGSEAHEPGAADNPDADSAEADSAAATSD